MQPLSPEITKAYETCRAITLRHGRHFSLAFAFLPRSKRRAIYATYAFCRFADDIADERPQGGTGEALAEWEAELTRCYNGRPTHPITVALSHALQTHPIPKAAFHGLIAGCRQDLVKKRYETFQELLGYCDMVATTIRDMSLPIFGYSDPRAQSLGRELSTALQLTNVIRDVGEDLDRDRIYLPLEDLERFGITDSELRAHQPSDRFRALMAFQCQRARGYFQRSADLIPLISADARLTVRLLRTVYLRLLDEIERRDYPVLTRQIRLTLPQKLGVVLWTVLGRSG